MNRALACFCFLVLLYAVVIGAMLTLCLDPPKAASRFTASVEEGDPFLPLTDEELRRMDGLAANSEYSEAIIVALTDFSDETLPKNDLMASIGRFTCCCNGRPIQLPWYERFWGR